MYSRPTTLHMCATLTCRVGCADTKHFLFVSSCFVNDSAFSLHLVCDPYEAVLQSEAGGVDRSALPVELWPNNRFSLSGAPCNIAPLARGDSRGRRLKVFYFSGNKACGVIRVSASLCLW